MCEDIVEEIRKYTKSIVHNPKGGCHADDSRKKKCSACYIDSLCQKIEIYYTDLV